MLTRVEMREVVDGSRRAGHADFGGAGNGGDPVSLHTQHIQHAAHLDDHAKQE